MVVVVVVAVVGGVVCLSGGEASHPGPGATPDGADLLGDRSGAEEVSLRGSAPRHLLRACGLDCAEPDTDIEDSLSADGWDGAGAPQDLAVGRERGGEQHQPLGTDGASPPGVVMGSARRARPLVVGGRPGDPFRPAAAFAGRLDGYVFTTGSNGIGYYADRPPAAPGLRAG